MSDSPQNNSKIQCNISFLNKITESEIASNFGIMKVLCSTQDLCFENIHWIFTIDKSGSMGDFCNDGKTKMNHIHQILTNMINYFIELT